MADLTGQTPAATYKGLLQVNDYTNGVDATEKYIQDGEGNDSALSLSTTNVGVGTDNPTAVLAVKGTEAFRCVGTDGNDKLRVFTANNGPVVGLGATVGASDTIRLDARTGTPNDSYFNGGNVGFGTTTPLAKVALVGDYTEGDTFQQIWDQKDEAVGHSGMVGAYTQYGVKWNNSTTPNFSYAIGVDTTSSTAGGNPDFKIGYVNNAWATPATNTRLTVTASGDVLPGADNTQALGSATKRWDVIYVKDTNITTSDREQKQDIEELTEAETRVARACKGLLRKYRWKDAVAEKDDEARIHFGIIAQDLEDAFTAEGLDAGRYGMFVKNTWWQAERVIPAVEAVDAVYDEDGNKISSAVLGRPETIVTDIFNNSEDAPEGATEVTQRGVRYSELLAFIIAAI